MSGLYAHRGPWQALVGCMTMEVLGKHEWAVWPLQIHHTSQRSLASIKGLYDHCRCIIPGRGPLELEVAGQSRPGRKQGAPLLALCCLTGAVVVARQGGGRLHQRACSVWEREGGKGPGGAFELGGTCAGRHAHFKIGEGARGLARRACLACVRLLGACKCDKCVPVCAPRMGA